MPASEVPSRFNNYYINVVKELSQNQATGPQSPTSTRSLEEQFGYIPKGDQSCSLEPVTAEEVSKYIDQLKNKSNVTFGQVTNKLLKGTKDNISQYIADIMNRSFEESAVPTLLKRARVCPIYKRGSRLICSNYRPISIFPDISKIIEIAVRERMLVSLDMTNFFSPQQYGFRRKRNTQ